MITPDNLPAPLEAPPADHATDVEFVDLEAEHPGRTRPIFLELAGDGPLAVTPAIGFRGGHLE